MPTLEDTVEFQALTLNDLLEADAKAVALPSEGEGKYRSWAYVSTAAAGLLAILLVVALVTKSGGGGSESTAASGKAKEYAGRPIHKPLKLTQAPSSDIQVDKEVSVYKDGNVVVEPVTVARLIPPKPGTSLAFSLELAMTKEQSAVFNKAFPAGEKGSVEIYVPGEPTSPATSPPATTTESTAPATSTPPASG